MIYNNIKNKLMFDKKEYSKKYYQDNKEKIKEYSKKYYYETSRPSKNIKPRQPKPYFKHIILEKPILICFN